MIRLSKEQVDAALDLICAKFRGVAMRRPLIKGCGAEVIAALAAAGVENGDTVMKIIVRHPRYLARMRAGTPRITLQGEPTEQLVTAEDEQSAKSVLGKQRERRLKRKAEKKANRKPEKPVLAPQVASQPPTAKPAPALTPAAPKVGLNGRPILSLRRSA